MSLFGSFTGQTTFGQDGFSLVEGHVETVVILSEARPCFALPLVNFGALANALYVQRVSSIGKVQDFALCDLSDVSARLVPHAPPKVSLGDAELFAIVCKNDVVRVGTRRSLRRLAIACSREAESELTAFAFADFASDPREAQRTAKALFNNKVEAIGASQAIDWFSQAVILRAIQRAFLDLLDGDESPELCVEIGRASISWHGERFTVTVPPKLHLLLDNTASNPNFREAIEMAMQLALRATDFAAIDIIPQTSPEGLNPQDLRKRPEDLAPWELAIDVLRRTPLSASWIERWLGYWEALHFRQEFELLALEKLIEHEGDIHLTGELLYLLLPYHAQLTERTLDYAIAWLSRSERISTRWPKILRRLEHKRKLPEELLTLAVSYLEQFLESDQAGHNEWISVWLLLDRHAPFAERKLRTLLPLALARFGPVTKLVNRVVLRDTNWRVDSQSHEEMMAKWIGQSPPTGDGWSAIYLRLLPRRYEDQRFVSLGYRWLSETRPGASGWYRHWSKMESQLGWTQTLAQLRTSALAEKSLDPYVRQRLEHWGSPELNLG